MHWIEFVAIIGATGAVVNAWLHKEGLFENWRDAIETWSKPRPAGYIPDPTGKHPDGIASYGYPSLGDDIRAKIAQMLQCRVCMTYHVALWILVIFYIPLHWISPPWSIIWFLPVYALAATRFSLLIGSAVAAMDIENDPEND